MKTRRNKRNIIYLNRKTYDTRNREYERIEYTRFIEALNKELMYIENTEEKILLLDYVIQLLAKEIRYSALLNFLNGNDEGRYILPILKMEYSLIGLNDYKNDVLDIEVDFHKNNIVAVPWRTSRILRKIKTIKKHGFKYEKNNHYILFSEYLNIGFVETGNHSIGLASFYEEGISKAKKIPLEKTFDYIKVDKYSTFFYNKEKILEDYEKKKQILTSSELETLDKIYVGADCKIGLIYTVGQIKYNLERNIRNGIR